VENLQSNFSHRADQAQVAFLDQIQQRQIAAGVALGHRDHEAQVGLHQVIAGPPDQGFAQGAATLVAQSQQHGLRGTRSRDI
jgi:hypothetical protein